MKDKGAAGGRKSKCLIAARLIKVWSTSRGVFAYKANFAQHGIYS